VSSVLPPSVESLVAELSRLPTIGRKSAQRLAFHVIKNTPPMAQKLANALQRVAEHVKLCPQCFFLTEGECCSLCGDNTRNMEIICVVEEPFDVVAFEKAGVYKGLYHVLHGRLSPLHGILPEHLKISELLHRVEKTPGIEEIIIATSPTVDGDATALYLAEKLRFYPCKVTRIGVGVAMGSTLELADELTLRHALERRRSIE